MNKHYINSQQLLNDSQHLALQVLDSGFRPELVIGIWRGGTPVAIALHEIFRFAGIKADHFSIRTLSYYGIGQQGTINVDGLEYVQRSLSEGKTALLVDDIFDSGRSIQAVFETLKLTADGDLPDIRVATPYFKPRHNLTSRIPDYYLHETDEWIVFPHELEGLSQEELATQKPGIDDTVRERLLAMVEK